MTDGPRGREGRLARLSIALENAALVILLGLLMLLATAQIALRFFDASLVWADSLIELLVLWIALVASIAAARSGRHLSIDILSHLLPDRLARLPQALASGFAAGLCGVIAWQGWRYVQLTREFEETAIFDIPAWIVFGLLPLAFAIMTWHFLVATSRHTWRLLRPAQDADDARESVSE